MKQGMQRGFLIDVAQPHKQFLFWFAHSCMHITPRLFTCRIACISRPAHLPLFLFYAAALKQYPNVAAHFIAWSIAMSIAFVSSTQSLSLEAEALPVRIFRMQNESVQILEFELW